MIAIIDYGAGNLINVKNILDYIGVESIITSNSKDVNDASKVILPGVCAFGYLMENLKQKKLVKSKLNSLIRLNLSVLTIPKLKYLFA